MKMRSKICMRQEDGEMDGTCYAGSVTYTVSRFLRRFGNLPDSIAFHPLVDPTRRSKIVEESGQSLVELVIVLPVLLLILAGVFDVGRAIQTYVVMLNASREAAIHGAATEVDATTLNGIILSELERGGVDASGARVTVEYQLRGFPPENHILVNVDYTLPLFLAVLSFETLDINCQTEMITFW